jgi:hypothetical protein
MRGPPCRGPLRANVGRLVTTVNDLPDIDAGGADIVIDGGSVKTT